MQGPVARLTTADPEMPRAGHSPGLGRAELGGWLEFAILAQRVGLTPTLQLLVLELPSQTLKTENSTPFEVWQESPKISLIPELPHRQPSTKQGLEKMKANANS